MRHPLVNVLTHPANRAPGRAAGYALDFGACSRWPPRRARRSKSTAPRGISTSMPRWPKQAAAAGATIVVDSDCHVADRLGRQMAFGIGLARRAGLRANQVLNTRDVAGVRAFVAAKRARPSLVVSCPTSMTRRLRLAALTLVLWPWPWLQGRAQPSLEGEPLARAIQRHYDTVRDFTADFEQAYVGGALKRRTVEKGTVAIRKPGRMRWDYTSPEAKQFISDGQRIYFYVPADKQVRVSPMPGGRPRTDAHPVPCGPR